VKKLKIVFLLFAQMMPAVIFAQSATKPNVVIIMADDLDSRQLSCYGGQNLKTVNIDALAKEGLKFNKMYASEAMCVPLRASLFTGLYPARHGSYQNHKRVVDTTKSVAHFLPPLGYTVALTGKNHSTKPEANFPFQIVKGFEPICVATTDDYDINEVKKFVTGAKKPFCLFVMSINPHAPWTVGDPSEFDADKLVLPPHWVDTKTTRADFTKYLAEVRRLDNQVGDVMKMLKETGKDKNTLVIFLGEQGPQFPGGKWTLYDNGAHSSMIARLPGVVKPGTVTDAIVQFEDITPTLIDLAGGKPISYLDGKSFLSVLQGKSSTHRDLAYGIHNNIPEGTAFPIRSVDDGRYKMIVNLTPAKSYYIKYSMNTENNKLAFTSWVEKAKTDPAAKKLVGRVVTHPPIELYDTLKDPYELNNLAGDPTYKSTIAKFRTKLDAWMKQQGDTGAAMDKPVAPENKGQ
jgi:arylsulfatase A-like enzyme